jgi:hypothetical protein
MPVTDLFEEYQNDIRWVKTFYLPQKITAVDFFFTVSINDSAKEAFKEEEARLFNIMIKNEKESKGDSISENSNLPKFDFESYVFALSADFFNLPDSKKVFKERIKKFFELVKSWTNVDYITIDMEYLEKYVNNSKIFKNVMLTILNDFKHSIKFKKNSEDRIKSLQSNLGFFKEKLSKTCTPKVVFITNENDLDNDIKVLDTLLKFVISCGVPKLYKKDQEKITKFIDKDIISQIVNQISGEWAKLRVFHQSLNKGLFPGEGLGIGDQTEFHNLHKLLPLVYGPTSLNFSYYSKCVFFENNS